MAPRGGAACQVRGRVPDGSIVRPVSFEPPLDSVCLLRQALVLVSELLQARPVRLRTPGNVKTQHPKQTACSRAQ